MDGEEGQGRPWITINWTTTIEKTQKATMEATNSGNHNHSQVKTQCNYGAHLPSPSIKL